MIFPWNFGSTKTWPQMLTHLEPGFVEKKKAWNKHLRIWKKFENRCFQTFIYVSIQLYEVVVKINAVTWCINFRKCCNKLSLLEALLSENHVFPVIEQSGRCQLEINDGILWVVTLSQTREHLGIIIFIMCFVGDCLYLQLRTTTIPCSLCWPLSFFLDSQKMIQKNPSEPEKKSS